MSCKPLHLESPLVAFTYSAVGGRAPESNIFVCSIDHDAEAEHSPPMHDVGQPIATLEEVLR